MLQFKDKITYWTKTGPYNTYGSPITVPCNKVNKQSIVKGHAGKEEVSKAYLYLRQEIPLGAVVAFGVSSSATPPEGSREVMAIEAYESSIITLSLVKVYLR